MKRTVGIDIFPLERERWSGIEIYTFELIKSFVNKGIDLKTFSLTEIEGNPTINETDYTYLRKGKASSLEKILYSYYNVKTLVKDEVDVYHCPNFTLPYGLDVKKKVLTLHDLAFLRFPEFYNLKTRLYFKGLLSSSLKRADSIICISHSCFEDLSYFYPEYSEKSRVIYNGFNNYYKNEKNPEILASFNIKGHFLLSVGATHPRKNLERIVLAFGELAKSFPDLQLVFAGTINSLALKQIISNAKLLSIENKIIVTNYISQESLIQLYLHADVLMFPSIYEGFGFPILEAMSCNTPVVTSCTSSCGELSGYDQKFLVNPLDVSDIVAKTKLILNPTIRQELIEQGLQRIKSFSWEKMCDETFELYAH